MLLKHALSERIKGSYIEADKCLNCWDAPCNSDCPAGINVSSFIRSLSKGDYASAAEIIERENPFGYICGWICPQEALCQKNCIAKQLGRAIDIRTLQRFAIETFRKDYKENTFLNDYEGGKSNINIGGKNHIENISAIPNNNQKRKKVAIIGAGPSGLTTGLFLLKMGYQVIIFEKEQLAGGRITHGIPDFRLPREIGLAEIESVSCLLTIEYGKEFGKDITISTLFEEGFSVIYLAIGKWKENSLDMKGSNLKGFFHADNILIGNDWEKIQYQNAAVIGAGNVAMDVARALKENNKKSNVYIIYRRTPKEMPTWQEEREDGWEEGVIFQFLSVPVEIVGDRSLNIQMIKCVRTLPGEIDITGRRQSDIVNGYEFNIPVDMVVTALGYQPDHNLLISQGLIVDEKGFVLVDENLKTNIENVFAGGDIIGKDRNTVVHAVADGKLAAINIHKHLSSRGENIG